MAVSDATKVVEGVVVIGIGLIMVPILASFLNTATTDANVTAITGLESLLNIIPYGVCIALMMLGFNLIKKGK